MNVKILIAGMIVCVVVAGIGAYFMLKGPGPSTKECPQCKRRLKWPKQGGKRYR